jgi:hypothetical protein
MKRETRDKFASGTDQADLTVGNACWETAPLVFAKLHEEFGPFDVDLTADAQRHLCPVWFGPGSNVGEFDALTADWRSHGTNGYSNPPYGPFIQRVLPIAKDWARQGFTSTFLLPLRVTKAFKAHVLRGATELIFPDKRLTFFENGVPRCSLDKKGRLRPDPALFDSILVRYEPDTQPDASPILTVWQVPPHVTAEDIERAALRRKEAA